ncbi:MAG: cupin domain-containing protein, partial [Clostridiales bacterium]|nr:cupin domain-containing protein [Clostridiales bacterium]
MLGVPRNHNMIFGFENNIEVRMDIIPDHFWKHRHSFMEIYIVLSGEGRDVINGKEYPLGRGVMAFLHPWHIHELFSNRENPVHLIRCSFGMELLMEETRINTDFLKIIYG